MTYNQPRSKYELRLLDLAAVERGDQIPVEILEQDHWCGVPRTDSSYTGRLRGLLSWVERHYMKLNPSEPVVCRQAQYGIELLFGINAVEYLNARSQSFQKGIISVGTKMETRIAKKDLTPQQQQFHESRVRYQQRLRHALSLANAEHSLDELTRSKPKTEPQAQRVAEI